MHTSVSDYVWAEAAEDLRHDILYTMYQVEERGDERFYWEVEPATSEAIFWRIITRAGDLRSACVRICLNCGEVTYPNRQEE